MSEDQHRNGKSHKKRKIKQKPVLEQVPAPQQQQQTEDGNSRFARALGSTDYGTREKGLQALSRFLLHKESMSELDMLKLWKGLFFCFWHSDKVPVQTELAERLAALLQQMKPAMAQLYLAGLLSTLRREWGAMDHHRLDKFLMLVRKFVGALLARLQATHWDAAAISSLTMQLPMGQSLIPIGTCKSLGLSYHLADVWLSELKTVAGKQAVPPDSMLLLLEPFVAVLEGSGEQALIHRVKEAVFDVLVADLAETAAAEGEQIDWMYCSKLDVGQLASKLFERGAAEGIKARNRQALYSASKDLERMAGKRRKLAAAAGAAGDEARLEHQKVREADRKQRQQQQAEQLQQPAEEQQELLSNRKKKKQKLPQELQGKQPQPQQKEPVANGVTPSSKKQKKSAELQQQQQQAAAAVLAATPVANTAPAAKAVAATPRVAANSSKKRKHSSANAAATPAAAVTPVSTAAAAAAVAPAVIPTVTPKAGTSVAKCKAAAVAAASPSTSKKGVKIDLRKNVYFSHGAPVPPEEVRSPPNTKPKGSALKTVSRLSKLKLKGGPAASAPAKQQQGSRLPEGQRPGSARKPVTPNSVPRVKAAAFSRVTKGTCNR